MAAYHAHLYFGMQVLEYMPPEEREAIAEDLSVFQMGLYGPDPLIFSLRTKWISDYLHKNWRKDTLPSIEQLVRNPDPALRSFAAGYYLHQVLDDVVHPRIYRWMEDGYSHLRLEYALDRQLVQEKADDRIAHFLTFGKDRAANAASLLISPADAKWYLRGLRNMNLLCHIYRGKRYPNKLSGGEQDRVGWMSEALQAEVSPAANRLSSLVMPTQGVSSC